MIKILIAVPYQSSSMKLIIQGLLPKYSIIYNIDIFFMNVFILNMPSNSIIISRDIEYCCHICARAAQSSLSSLDSAQKLLRDLQPLISRRNSIPSDSTTHYHHFYDSCLDELCFLISPAQITARKSKAIRISRYIPLVK